MRILSLLFQNAGIKEKGAGERDRWKENLVVPALPVICFPLSQVPTPCPRGWDQVRQIRWEVGGLGIRAGKMSKDSIPAISNSYHNICLLSFCSPLIHSINICNHLPCREHLLHARHLQAQHFADLTSFHSHKNPVGKALDDPHFTEGQTEAQRGPKTMPLRGGKLKLHLGPSLCP